MELRTSFVKTFQRFSIPRSKSSIGSFSTSMNEQIEDDASASKRRHPPLSYNQHIRSMATSSVRATSTVENNDSLTSQSTNSDHLKNESQRTRDLTLNSRIEITTDNPQINERPSMNHSRTSLKSFFVKKFQPSSNSSSNIEMLSNNQTKQKKRRTSFRQISQILKRSHSAHGDLTTNVVKHNHEEMVLYDNESSPRLLTAPLRTISEEENGIQQQKQRREASNHLEQNSSNNHANSSSPSVSNRSSTSNRLSSATNSSSTRPDDGNSKSKTSRPLSTYQQKDQKNYLTNSLSLHTNVNQLSNLNDSQLKSSSEHLTLHHTRSYTPNDFENNQTAAVKLRERTSKKKKLMRDLKPRISLPPEIKNNVSQIPSINNFDAEHSFTKPLGKTSNYRVNSRSTQALDRSFNQSIPSLNALSNGHLSRLEYRRSMLDLGWGKLESYVKLEKLGEGTYATVYKGTSNLRSGFVALKEIRLEQEEGAPCTALREVSLLKGLKHNNIVCLYDIIFDRTTLTLVFEYVERDLKRYMDDCENLLSMKNVRLFLFQLLRGLEFCHSKKILHRDLKPQNLLINERGELKLADFGLARIKSFPTKNYSNEVVTLWYRPPDVLLGSTEYSTPIDIWAVGCIFYEMVQGRPLFAGSKVDEELKIIFKYLGTPNETTMPGVTSNPDFLALELPRYSGEAFPRSLSHLDAIGIELLMKFLRYNPSERISAYDAMHHAFFSSYPKEIYQLKPEQSVLVFNELFLHKDPGSRFSATALMKTAISKRSSVHL